MHAVYNIAMDCITFNKDIIAYLDGELGDEELNDFLHHLKTCEACAEELEINYIVREGVKLLNRKNSSYGGLCIRHGGILGAACLNVYFFQDNVCRSIKWKNYY